MKFVILSLLRERISKTTRRPSFRSRERQPVATEAAIDLKPRRRNGTSGFCGVEKKAALWRQKNVSGGRENLKGTRKSCWIHLRPICRRGLRERRWRHRVEVKMNIRVTFAQSKQRMGMPPYGEREITTQEIHVALTDTKKNCFASQTEGEENFEKKKDRRTKMKRNHGAAPRFHVEGRVRLAESLGGRKKGGPRNADRKKKREKRDSFKRGKGKKRPRMKENWAGTSHEKKEMGKPGKGCRFLSLQDVKKEVWGEGGWFFFNKKSKE